MTYTVLWLRRKPRTRGPRPAYSLETIVAAAIRVADAEGLDAVVMRRVAAELGTSATALYRYVASKEDLCELMLDAAIGPVEPLVPGPDWREDFAAIAHATRALFLRHPWLLALLAGRPSLGPNRLQAAEEALALGAAHGLDPQAAMAALDLLFAYVRGQVMEELANREALRRANVDASTFLAAQLHYEQTLIASGRYPHLAPLLATTTRTPAEAEAHVEQHFASAVRRILAGF